MSHTQEKAKKGRFNVPYFIKNLDMFGYRVPEINVRGQTKVKTSMGACVSITIAALTIAFGLVKLDHLVQFKNPVINILSEPLPEGEIY